jgi:hypothetical protein
MKNKQSAVNILYEMRKKLNYKLMHYKVVSFSLLGILIILYIITSLLNYNNIYGLMSALLVFIWCIYSIYSILKIKQEQDNIDEFYLFNAK